MDAFDEVIAVVNFDEVDNFDSFVEATNGRYMLLVQLIYELVAELSLSRSTLISPVLPKFESYSQLPLRQVGDAHTLNTRSDSWIQTIINKIKNVSERNKLIKKVQFMQFTSNLSRRGLQDCIPNGTGTLNIMTMDDAELCYSTLFGSATSAANGLSADRFAVASSIVDYYKEQGSV